MTYKRASSTDSTGGDPKTSLIEENALLVETEKEPQAQMNVVGRRIDAANLFNCDDLSEFSNSIIRPLNYMGVSNSTFYLCEYGSVRFLVKMMFHRKSPAELFGGSKKLVGTISTTDAEINIMKVFRERFIYRNITPCLLELVYDRTCEGFSKKKRWIDMCEHLMLDANVSLNQHQAEFQVCAHLDAVADDLAHDKITFAVLERCDITLNDFMNSQIGMPVIVSVVQSVLFMMIYTFYSINKVYPKFRHLDTHNENVMLKFDPLFKFEAHSPKFYVFTIEGVKYAVPYFGFIPKLIDFGYSVLPEENLVSEIVLDRKFMAGRYTNDLILLMHWLTRSADAVMAAKMKKLCSKLVPNLAFEYHYPRGIKTYDASVPTYLEMLKNPVWDEYRNFTPTPMQIYKEFNSVDE